MFAVFLTRISRRPFYIFFASGWKITRRYACRRQWYSRGWRCQFTRRDGVIPERVETTTEIEIARGCTEYTRQLPADLLPCLLQSIPAWRSSAPVSTSSALPLPLPGPKSRSRDQKINAYSSEYKTRIYLERLQSFQPILIYVGLNFIFDVDIFCF